MAAVLGERDHRRLGALVAEMRRQAANDDAGGGERDNRPPGEEQRFEMLCGIVEAHIGFRHALGESM